MKDKTLMTINELACLIRSSPANINSQIYKGNEGKTLPFSLRIGSKRLWLSDTVFTWLKEKEIENKASCFQKSTGIKPQDSIKRL
ncbi:MAG: hypothetical protein GY928_06900 [Colwellia sp.]|nr:hypothetical protein [Colwellia sp.]